MRTKEFILSRETEGGGFSFAATTPATLEDTYYTVRSLDILGTKDINASTFFCIKQIESSKLSGLRQTYWLLYLLRKLNPSSNKVETVKPPNTQRLQDIYYYVLTQELLGEKPCLGEKESQFFLIPNRKL